jgi:hypothetical protein
MLKKFYILLGFLTAVFFSVTGEDAIARSSGNDFSSKKSKDDGSGKTTKEKQQKPKPQKYEKSPDGLNALINLSKTRKEMTAVYDKETANYARITKAIDEGRVNKGQTADEIKAAGGDPVIVTPGDNDTTKWVYKIGKEGYSTKSKVYLIFDKNNVLVDIVKP